MSYYSVRTGGVLKQTFHVDGGESIEAVSLELMPMIPLALTNHTMTITLTDKIYRSDKNIIS